MKTQNTGFSPGDVVRVRPDRIDGLTVAFANRVRDRDAVIDCQRKAYFRSDYYWVVFQKRNGRGKEFRESLRADDLHLVRAAQQEAA